MRKDTLLKDLQAVDAADILHAYCAGDNDLGLTGYIAHEDISGLLELLQPGQWRSTEISLDKLPQEGGGRPMGIYLHIPAEGQTVGEYQPGGETRILHEIAITREGDLAYNAFLQDDDRFFACQMPEGTAQKVGEYVRAHRVDDQVFDPRNGPDTRPAIAPFYRKETPWKNLSTFMSTPNTASWTAPAASRI